VGNAGKDQRFSGGKKKKKKKNCFFFVWVPPRFQRVVGKFVEKDVWRGGKKKKTQVQPGLETKKGGCGWPCWRWASFNYLKTGRGRKRRWNFFRKLFLAFCCGGGGGTKTKPLFHARKCDVTSLGKKKKTKKQRAGLGFSQRLGNSQQHFCKKTFLAFFSPGKTLFPQHGGAKGGKKKMPKGKNGVFSGKKKGGTSFSQGGGKTIPTPHASCVRGGGRLFDSKNFLLNCFPPKTNKTF